MGGLGNDYHNGGNGADTYVFGKGSGLDVIFNHDTDIAGEQPDRIEFSAQVLPTEVNLIRSGNDLIVRIHNTTDQLTVQSYFQQDAASVYAV